MRPEELFTVILKKAKNEIRYSRKKPDFLPPQQADISTLFREKLPRFSSRQ